LSERLSFFFVFAYRLQDHGVIDSSQNKICYIVVIFYQFYKIGFFFDFKCDNIRNLL